MCEGILGVLGFNTGSLICGTIELLMVLLFVCLFETGFCYVVQAGLELDILLLHLSAGMDKTCVPPCPSVYCALMEFIL